MERLGGAGSVLCSRNYECEMKIQNIFLLEFTHSSSVGL